MGSNTSNATATNVNTTTNSTVTLGGTQINLGQLQATSTTVIASDVTVTPSGSLSSTNVQEALTELQVDLDAIVASVSQDASTIPATPSGNLLGDNVQAQLDFLQTQVDSGSAGGEINVQSDFNEADPLSDRFIRNKPVLATATQDGLISAADKAILDALAGADTQAQIDAINAAQAVQDTRLGGIDADQVIQNTLLDDILARLNLLETGTPFVLSFNNSQTFNFTGADQTLDLSTLAFTETDPANQRIRFRAVGAGGFTNTTSADPNLRAGGSGGYSEIILNPNDPAAGFSLTDTLRVMVGRGGGENATGTVYGFGGENTQFSGGAGGGLSGVFNQTTAIQSTDFDNALVVAGGGAGGTVLFVTPQNTINSSIIHNGNEVGNLTEPDMMGSSEPADSLGVGGGAGGGFRGGGNVQSSSELAGTTTVNVYEAFGGTGFVHPSAISSIITSSPILDGTIPVEAGADFDNVGRGSVAFVNGGQDGRIIVDWN